MKKKIIEMPTAAGTSAAPIETLNRFGSKRDVAAMVGMSIRSVDNFLAAGLPHVKLSKRRVRFDLPECREWFKKQFGQQRRGASQAIS